MSYLTLVGLIRGSDLLFIIGTGFDATLVESVTGGTKRLMPVGYSRILWFYGSC
jgi:hypothetical protein